MPWKGVYMFFAGTVLLVVLLDGHKDHRMGTEDFQIAELHEPADSQGRGHGETRGGAGADRVWQISRLEV